MSRSELVRVLVSTGLVVNALYMVTLTWLSFRALWEGAIKGDDDEL